MAHRQGSAGKGLGASADFIGGRGECCEGGQRFICPPSPLMRAGGGKRTGSPVVPQALTAAGGCVRMAPYQGYYGVLQEGYTGAEPV